MSIQLEITDFLAFVDLSGVEALTSDKVEKLENYIHMCNNNLLEDSASGSIFVDDAVYDRLRDILREVKPESKYLGLWTDGEDEDVSDISDDNMDLLNKFPMVSINTIKNVDETELREFINALPYYENEEFDFHYSLKENGHGVCLGGEYGQVDYAYPRGRSGTRRDLTRQMHIIHGDFIEGLSDFPRYEIRGEVVLPFSNFAIAKEYNPKIKTAFTGVSSMLRDSATEEETSLLHFVAYRFIAEGFSFNTKEDEYAFLEELGFTTPFSVVQGGVTKENLVESMNSVLEDFADDIDNYEYFTDGVVCQVNDYEIFNSMGMETNGRYFLGNVALKDKYWKQDCYSGYVLRIEWTEGKNKFSPVAIVTDGNFDEDGKPLGVPTANGNRVSRVPLYEPANILQLEAYVDNVLFFRYGGESGVVPCYPNGRALVDGYAKKLLDNNDDDDEQYFYMEATNIIE